MLCASCGQRAWLRIKAIAKQARKIHALANSAAAGACILTAMAHNFPQWHRLYRVVEEIDACAAARNRMRQVGVRPICELETAWHDFLMRIELVWRKLKVAGKTLPGWQQIETEVAAARSTDPLLVYVHHARNAHEHTIQEITAEWAGPIAVSNVTSTGYTTSIPAWDRPLRPVVDRGVTYQPPRDHLGKSIAHELGQGVAEPCIAAEHALLYYHSVVVRAAANVSWPGPPPRP